MTRDEAIEILSRPRSMKNVPDDIMDAHEMAIKALEQQTCEDAISRQAVLDYLDKMPSELTSDGRRMVRRRTLEEYISDTLPSVKPQYTDDEIQKMQDLEQAEIEKAYELGKTEGQNSEDAVSRQAAIDAFEKFIHELGIEDEPYNYGEMALSVQNVPSVNPQPKIGHWKKMVEVYDLQQNRMLVPYGYDDAKFGNTPVYVCDCGCESNKNSRFCPDCGAKMEVEE